jgi:uncharacterized protein YndB with AHSA1/START domain
LSRTFDAPRALVWDVFTKAEHLKQWMGPGGSLTHATIDLKPGGLFHYGMALPNGQTMWGKWTFVEVVPPEKLVVLVAFSDADKGFTTHPMSPTWPRQTKSITTFTEKDGKTTIRLEWTAYDATAEQQATFDGARGSMTQGWKGTYDALDAYLATLTK